MALIYSLFLIVAGAVPVLLFAGLLAWQMLTLFQGGIWMPLPVLVLFGDHALPEALVPVLSRIHVALLPALAGLAVMALGVRRLLVQRAVMRARRQYHEDRRRRVQDYQRDDRPADALDGRREPFISGFGEFGLAQKNPAQRGARAG